MSAIDSLKPPRSLAEVVEQLLVQMKVLPLTDPRRAVMAQQIVSLEDEISARAAKNGAKLSG